MERLFIYGTLRDSDVQMKLINRILAPVKSYLEGYIIKSIIQGTHSYPIISFTGNKDDIVPGDVVEVTERELIVMDEYEGVEYERRNVRLTDGSTAWVYCWPDT